MSAVRLAAGVLVLTFFAAVAAPTSAYAQTAPAVFALGGAAVLPDEAVQRAGEGLGAQPVRLAGAGRFDTAAAISRHAHPDGATTLYLTGTHDLADTLAAAGAVAARDAAVLPIPRDWVPEAILREVERLAPERVYVVGGPAAISENVREGLAEHLGQTVRRLAAADRYATAALLSQHANRDGAATVYVSGGHAAADGLAALAGVAVHDAPLLLTTPDALPEPAARELRRLAPGEVVVVGGPGAVSDTVLQQIRELTGVAPRRVHGPDRITTARAMAAHADPHQAGPRYLLSSRDHTDAFAAPAALAAHRGALLLIDPAPELRWIPRPDEAIAYARTRAGSVSFAAIGTDGALLGHRAETRVPAASVLKVMFMVAHLRTAADRELTQSDRALLEPMIRRSANEPATQIANRLGPGPMYQLAADVGMRDFSYTRPWGNSRTSARDQARFLREVDRFVPERHRAYALRLLTEVVPEQRWGIGEVATPGWTQHFKGGWGSGTGATDHQVVLLRHRDGTRVALAVMTTSSPSHAYGKDTLRGVFQRLLADLPRDVA